RISNRTPPFEPTINHAQYILAEQLPHLLMNPAIRGQNLTAVEQGGLSLVVGHLPACLRDEQRSGTDIPAREVPLPEAVEHSGRHIGKIDSRGPWPSHRPGLEMGSLEFLNFPGKGAGIF